MDCTYWTSHNLKISIEFQVEEVEAVDAVVVVEDEAEVARKTRKNGLQSPSWAVWFVKQRSAPWRKFTCTPCPSKNSRSSISSWVVHCVTKSWKSCLSRNKLVLVREPDSRLLLPSVIRMDTLDWALSAARKLPLLFVAPSFWPSCRSSQFDVVIGVTRSVNPTPFLARLVFSLFSLFFRFGIKMMKNFLQSFAVSTEGLWSWRRF